LRVPFGQLHGRHLWPVPSSFAEEQIDPMTELQVTVSFACCGCEEPISVTVVCQGKASDEQPFAGKVSVNVPCPTCSEINQLLFEPGGVLHSVRLFRQRMVLPVPSVN
jgi:hypothetical protein